MSTADSMLEVFIFETQQLLETLEDILLGGEKRRFLTDEQVNEIFRVMHTIKGSASMMEYGGIAETAHAVEDMFSNIRDKKARQGDWDEIFDIVLAAADFIRGETARLEAGQSPGGGSPDIIEKIRRYLGLLSRRAQRLAGPERAPDPPGEEFGDFEAPYYKIRLAFEPESRMTNIRAFGAVNALSGHYVRLAHIPADLMDDGAGEYIEKNGFTVYIQSNENPDDLRRPLEGVMFVESLSLIAISGDNFEIPERIRPRRPGTPRDVPSLPAGQGALPPRQNFISINVNKLDRLMELVGEIAASEPLLTGDAALLACAPGSFERPRRPLHGLIDELWDLVLSIRMLPISTVFHKMQRLVRDMSKKVGKEAELVLIGEETEVDKNLIDALSAPLIHLVRNAVDHGLETVAERTAKGKPPAGRVTLEARRQGGDLLVTVRDDGRGLDRAAIIKLAAERDLGTELSDEEAYSLLFLPGFSTKPDVTEYSGRGVGLDAARRDVEKAGGSIAIKSDPGRGTAVRIRIPLTVSVVEGLKLRAGGLHFIVPLTAVRETLRPDGLEVFTDADGGERVRLPGASLPLLRLREVFDAGPGRSAPPGGVFVAVRAGESSYCLCADELLGAQQAVMRPLPAHLQGQGAWLRGVGGCAVLGDGSFSFIIDVGGLAP